MKKQALTLAIAVALSAPSALAAQDTSGMRYTSASEGFYASIRIRYESKDGGIADGKSRLQDAFSRVGVRGSNDLGGGLEGFYQYEWEVNTNSTDRGQARDRTRVGVVGLRGAFGEFRVGTFWVRSNDFVTGHTDVANVNSAAFTNTGYRDANRVEYTTPNLNGFQGAVRLAVDGGSGSGAKNVDEWNVSAKYDIKGFTVGALYQNTPDGLAATDAVITNLGTDNVVGGGGAGTDTTVAAKKKDDQSAWAVGLRYGQDNWYAAGWYGVTDSRNVLAEVDNGSGNDVAGAFTDEDQTIVSLASGVSLDKVSLYGVWEKRDGNARGQDGQEDTQATLGAQYNLGANSRVWLEYTMRDNDSDKAKDKGARADDSFNVGLRHDF